MSLKRPRDILTNSPMLNALIVSALAFILIFFITLYFRFYEEKEFWMNLVAGVHNLIADILIISVVIFWLNRRIESRIEINRRQEDIDTWRGDSSSTATKKNQTSIRRLNEQGVREIDLSTSALQGCDLTSVKLSGSNLVNAECFETIFTEADLTNAILNGANLKRADLRNAVLDGARLRGAMLNFAQLQGASLKGVDFTGATISNVTWDGATYDLSTIFPYEFPDKEKMTCVGRSQ